MLRRYYIWRAERRMGRSNYRIDRRHYRGIFSPGFFAHLSRTKFWQTDNDPHYRARRRRKRITLVISLILLAGFIWILFESSRALEIF